MDCAIARAAYIGGNGVLVDQNGLALQ